MKLAHRLIVLFIVSALLVVGGWLLLRGADIPVLQPTGEVGKQQQALLMLTVVISAAVVIPVFGLLIFISVRYRASNTKAAYRPDWDDNKLLETIWWGIPIAIIATLAVITWFTTHSLDPYKPREGSGTVKIQAVALQWKWLFIYPAEGIATVNQLSLPVDTPIHFDISADAPMSALWIPSLGSQIYAMNGMNSQLNAKAEEIGRFKGYNTNINGEGYSSMTFDTNVLSKNDYNRWKLSAKQDTKFLTKADYEKLAEPSKKVKPALYGGVDKGLYSYIMMKYMASHDTGKAEAENGSSREHIKEMEKMSNEEYSEHMKSMEKMR